MEASGRGSTPGSFGTWEVVRACLALGSLARICQMEAGRSRGHTWLGALLLGPWGRLRRGWRSFMYVWFAVLAGLLIALPLPDPGFGPFAEPASAEEFLRTLWQVEAAALALSLTIIVFAVQAYQSSSRERYGGTLRRFIRDSFLQEGYELGVTSLLLLAVILLGVGHGGPSGSAGLVAAAAALLSIAILPPLLARALRNTNRDFFQLERSARLAAAVRGEVDRDVETRIGILLLRGLGEARGFDWALFGGAQDPGIAIVAGEDGVVEDLGLMRLLFLTRLAQGRGRVRLTVHPSQYLGSESKILFVPDGASARELRQAHKVVRIKRETRRQTTMASYLDDLREEAVAAIRSGGPAAFDSIAEAYVDTLMEFPRSWRRYGQEYDDAIAQGIEFFPVGPVEDIRRQLYANVVEALRAGSQDVVLTAAYLPFRVATRALPFSADGLLRQMLALSPSILAAAWASGGDVGALLEERARRHLIEFVRFQLEPRLEGSSVAERTRIGSHIRLAFSQIEAMLKMAIDSGRIGFLRRLDGDWGTLLQHSDMEILDPDPLEISFLEQAVEQGEPFADRLEEARRNAEIQQGWEELTEFRTLARFGLVLWAWREPSPDWRESFDHFAAELGGAAEIARATTRAFEAEYRDLMPWSNWFLNELQEGEAHAIPTTAAILDTFVALGLRAVVVDHDIELPPGEWMATYRQQIEGLLDDAAEDPRNADLADLAERVESLRKAVDSAIRRWSEEDRLSLIQAPLAEEKVERFRAEAVAAVDAARVVPDLVRLGGTIHQVDPGPDPSPSFKFQASKALFIADGRMVGGSMVARDIGRKVAHIELGELIDPMSEATTRPFATEGSADQLEDDFVRSLLSLVEQTTNGTSQEFFALFLPISWRLSRALHIQFRGGGVEPPDDWALGEGPTNYFVGEFGGRPVFRFPEVPGEVLYLVNLGRYVEAEAWGGGGGERLSVNALSEEEAKERAAATKPSGDIDESEIALRWQEQVTLTLDRGFKLSSQRDINAVTAVELPEGLRR